MKKIGLTIVMFLLIGGISFGVNAGSNLNGYDYPSHGLTPPVEPQEPILRDQISLRKYGEEITAYQKKMEEHRAQVELYIENAKNDIDLIDTKIDEALDDFNNSVDSANTWLDEDYEKRYGGDEADE